MIDPLEGITNTQPLNQSAGAHKASNNGITQTTPTDIIQISDEAITILEGDNETHGEILIRAKCGDLHAQRLLKRAAVTKELLGLD